MRILIGITLRQWHSLVVKCSNCNGRLSSDFNICPYCGVRVEVDLKQVHFRDLGPNPNLPCPDCATPLNVIEFQSDPKVAVERCPSCFGMFFNPGEVELFLETHTTDVVWLDNNQLNVLAKENPNTGEDIRYAACPICRERMSHINFGKLSGVILDWCGTHSLWLQNGELRRLAEWWRLGGKHLYEEHQKQKASRLLSPLENEKQPRLSNNFDFPISESYSKDDITPTFGKPFNTPSPWNLLGIIADFLNWEVRR